MLRRSMILLLPLLALASCDGSGCGAQATDPQAAASATTSATARPAPAVAADPREAFLAKSLAAVLAKQHLLHRAVDDDVSRKAFEEYVEALDGRKLFLLAPQVDELRSMADQMDDELSSGDLLLGRRGQALLLERREVVAKLVAELLTKPFDFSKDERLETDPDKLTYCADEAALRERWRKVLKLQVLQRVASMEELEKARAEAEAEGSGGGSGAGAEAEDIPATLEGKERKAREAIATSYEARFKRLADGDPLEPAERFVNAITAVYDPHTRYLPPADKENFDIEMSGSLEGIGALLGVKDHHVEVRELVPGGASWRQGELGAGDLILAVTPEGGEPVDVTDMALDRVVDLIRGPKGTVVTLRVQKPDGRIESVAITRDVIVIEAAYARGAELEPGGGAPSVGYIHLPGFYGNTRRDPGATGERNASDDVRRLLEIFDERKVPGVIVDLRGNGGGLLGHARDIAGHFIETGPIVQARSYDGSSDVHSDDDPTVSYHGEVVVLVDRFSASASEILAGALQDYRRAVVVGTGPTHGKGTVQVLLELDRLRRTKGPPLGVLKLTSQQYFLVDGDSTQSRGVQPDVVLPDPAGYLETGERFLEHAIPWSEVEPLRYRAHEPPWDVAALVAASRERVEGEKLFSAVETRNRVLEARRDDTVVPLSREGWLKRRGEAEEKLEEVRSVIEAEHQRFEVRPIEYGPKAPGAGDERVEAQMKRWREGLSEDAWVAEALHVVADMIEAASSSEAR